MIPSPRQRLEEWGRALPGLWRAIDAERAAWDADRDAWPAPVFLPLERAGAATMAAIRAKGDAPPAGPAGLAAAACTTQCLATWRMTQGIYRIDPALYGALIDTPVTGDIPADVLLYLPEWCVYIETPGMTVPARQADSLPVSGLWYWLDWSPQRDTILCIGIDLGRRPPLTVQHVPLVGTIEAAIAATMREWESALAQGNAERGPPPGYADAVRAWLPPAISLVLYLCSRAAEIGGRGEELPGNPTRIATRRQGARLYPAAGLRQWEVGARLGAALRAAGATESGADYGTHHVRPHIRRAHWHTFLAGPRDGERSRQLQWLPPIPVAVEDYDTLPATIRPVHGGDT